MLTTFLKVPCFSYLSGMGICAFFDNILQANNKSYLWQISNVLLHHSFGQLFSLCMESFRFFTNQVQSNYHQITLSDSTKKKVISHVIQRYLQSFLQIKKHFTFLSLFTSLPRSRQLSRFLYENCVATVELLDIMDG